MFYVLLTHVEIRMTRHPGTRGRSGAIVALSVFVVFLQTVLEGLHNTVELLE